MVIHHSISWPRQPHVPAMPGQSPSDHVGQQNTEEFRPAQQSKINFHDAPSTVDFTRQTTFFSDTPVTQALLCNTKYQGRTSGVL